MKVIEHGKRRWSKKVTCRGCQAVLEIEADDLVYNLTEEHTLQQQYQEEIEGEYIAHCLDCGQTVRIKDVPPNIKEYVQNSISNNTLTMQSYGE